jgi:hypothetical protein
MDTLATVIGGLGVLGVFAVIVIGWAILAMLPIWAIIDCANSGRDSSNKTLIIVLLCLTWGIGSLAYGAFVTDSPRLRRFSLISVLTLVVVFILSVGSCMVGASRGTAERKVEEEKLRTELQTKGFKNFFKGQTFSIQKDITEPTFYDAQTVNLLAGSTADLYIKAQSCEVHGVIDGNLTFRGQTLTIQPNAVIKGNLDVEAQVLKRYGKVMGNTDGKVQVQE